MTKKKRLKVLVFIDHDIIIRHFIKSGVFSELAAKHDVLFCLISENYKNGARIRTPLESLGLGDRLRRIEVDDYRQGKWAKLTHVSRLKWRPGQHMRHLRDFTRHAIGPGHVREYTFLSLPGVYHWFERKTLREIVAHPNTHLEKLFDEELPDVVFHPSVLYGPLIHDLCCITAERRIPMTAIMNSWDNPASKANIYLALDRLLVWGEQTRDHAVKYLKIHPSNVTIFGAAQFDVYRNPARVTRSEYERLHEIPSGSKILLYAGASKGADEFAHLCLLDEAVERGDFGEKTAVLYRPHPWGNGGKGGKRIIDHPWRNVFLELAGKPYLESLREGDQGITLADYKDTIDTLSNVDAVISPLSTIILEAAMLGKPSICLLPYEEGAVHFNLAAGLAHFQEIYAWPEFLKARGVDELVPKAVELMQRSRDTVLSARLIELSNYFAQRFDEPYASRLVTYAESLFRE